MTNGTAPQYTSGCGEAAQAYIRELWGDHWNVRALNTLPATFRWSECFDRMIAAAKSTPPADDAMVVGLSDDRRDAIATQAVNERWPKGWSRSNKLAAMGMVRYAVDAAIAAMRQGEEG